MLLTTFTHRVKLSRFSSITTALEMHFKSGVFHKPLAKMTTQVIFVTVSPINMLITFFSAAKAYATYVALGSFAMFVVVILEKLT